MLEFEEYKVKLNNLKPALEVLRGALKLDAAQKEIEELEAASEREGFWNDVERSQKVQKRLIRAQVELEMAGDYDYFVINDTVEQAVEELRAILCAEHCKPAERMNMIINRKEM